MGCKRNVKPEMAELKGKRLIIAAELEEGSILYQIIRVVLHVTLALDSGIERNLGTSILHIVPIAQDVESMQEVPQIFILPLILSDLPERRPKKACSLRA